MFKNRPTKLCQKGEQYIDSLVQEIESYMDKYEDFEPQTRINLMKRDQIDPLRARFLWGIYDGEFDDLVQWQAQAHSFKPFEDWRQLITSKDFYDFLFQEIKQAPQMDSESLDSVLDEPSSQWPAKASIYSFDKPTPPLSWKNYVYDSAKGECFVFIFNIII